MRLGNGKHFEHGGKAGAHRFGMFAEFAVTLADFFGKQPRQSDVERHDAQEKQRHDAVFGKRDDGCDNRADDIGNNGVDEAGKKSVDRIGVL